ncbi:MAG: thioredoxin family protein [Chloroflexi bacterium AL-W]|nr:thioredoxin family protein [Chloroflexi bacterium AL-N1]NOK67190.1 thioredoxin family protein [Chloroflexi bacterium AL-N10]NOK75316.1 thioredoxin family protein [Chloroflexi bacterium AL-N5]NOK82104.1 thioredoxin family protein [Chloroflexi bacterium AL-W]NOK89949.1 thioredoxin family protein [Chloroflexi bacterium AL-N15]
MKQVQILGSGCAKCQKLADHAEAAARSMGIDYELQKITDMNEIIDFGVMVTPALAVDGYVKVSGKIPSVDEIKRLLS